MSSELNVSDRVGRGMAPAFPRGAPSVVLLIFAAASAGCGRVETQGADPFTQTGELIAVSGGEGGARAACITCHGLDGGGDGELVPRLAGLPRGYLQKQLEDYAAGRRPHEAMGGIAKALGQGDRALVAQHYAALGWERTATTAGPSAFQQLYLQGDRSRGLLPCAQCHGSAGEGGGQANPPLAQQPAGYLADQLHRWKAGTRRNDPQGLMLDISRRLSAVEIEGLARYAASLSGAPARPGELREPFLQTRRPDQ